MKKQNILVLSDLKNSTNSTLKSAVSIAKMINGNIDLLHVKKPIDVVTKESQLSAIRTLNKDSIETSKKIKNIIDPTAKKYGLTINYKFSVGNLKNEVEQYIKEKSPDVIVLGKQKKSPFNLLNNNVTDFIINKFNGTVFIIQDKNELEPSKPISLGVLNSGKSFLTSKTTKSIATHVVKPIVSFNLFKNKEEASVLKNDLDKEDVSYVFEKNSNTIKNLASYLVKNKTHLLHINRKDNKEYLTKTDIKTVINKLNVSLVLT
ncbi:universal stress protein [Tenacibaculum retecalamus]|uniref:universal stress protein n=1 Tax=Tenacibaculum retecalamus TaxID=3018315 RepID=UPI0023D91231|nr:universal stress protein [Tenacibaculum retecalamus]WBX71448.1 universal stress protein [Tenacibaculum retecalamus]